MEEQEVQLTQAALNKIAENRAKAMFELLALRKQRLPQKKREKQEAENKQRNQAHNSSFSNPSMNASIASSLFRAQTINAKPVLGNKQQVSGISPYGHKGHLPISSRKSYVSFSVVSPTRVKVTVKPYSDPVIAVVQVFDKEISGKVKLDHLTVNCFSFGLQRQGRILLADEMGLGKSSSPGIARYYNEEWPLLIICPSSVNNSEVSSCILDYDISSLKRIRLPSKNAFASISCDVSKINDQQVDELKSHSFYVIIFDESHFFERC
uniref:SNF2 N-terminal domain-containing protein n=1 Tax=Ditylenchus dipsaci TaxID=166011 RepID=A0A915E1W9_9BILA